MKIIEFCQKLLELEKEYGKGELDVVLLTDNSRGSFYFEMDFTIDIIELPQGGSKWLPVVVLGSSDTMPDLDRPTFRLIKTDTEEFGGPPDAA